MGRPERQIDPADGPLAEFAIALRQLRRAAGSPAYRMMARLAHFSDTALSTAANGVSMPSLAVTVGYVRACGGDVEAWQRRWHETAKRLGLDTGPSTSRAQEESPAGPAGDNAPARFRPAQLPASVTPFTGRSAELARLRMHAAARGSGVAVALITGPPGVGKTSLAVHFSHEIANQFPDGQLYVNLRGFDPSGQPVTASDALRGLLSGMGVPAARIPAELDAQGTLYRSLLAGRHALVVLDNARDSGQVRPLLPGVPGCLVVVTSRDQMSGLIATNSAHLIDLDVLNGAEARELLACRIGASRVTAERQAAEEIVALCGGLPLALVIVASRAAVHPWFSLHSLAAELRDTHDRCDTLSIGDPFTDIRAVFSWSDNALTPAAARLLRLLGLHPGPDISGAAAASLAGLTLPETLPLLAELAQANLIVEHIPRRYAFHDLLRAYATRLAQTAFDARQRRSAIRRVLDHYRHTACTAALLLKPSRDSIALAAPQPGTNPENLTCYPQALDWFTSEHAVLLAAVDHAAESGLDAFAWQLGWALVDFLDLRGYWHDQVTVQTAALAAARRAANPGAQAHAHRVVAQAYGQLHRYADADTHLQQALVLYRRLGDHVGEARTHRSIAQLCSWQGCHRAALDHARQALDLYQGANHMQGRADMLNAVGWHHAQLGDYQQALIACQRALTLQQELGDRLGQAGTWDSLGYTRHHLGHHEQAVSCFQRALDLYRDLGHRYYEADTLIHLGDAHHVAGNAAARDAWHDALAILDDLDHPDADQLRAKLSADGPER